MKKISIHKILIIILLIGSTQTLYAQKSTTKNEGNHKWFVGIKGGVNMYWGDIKFNSFWPAPNMHELQPGGGLVLGRTLSPAFKLSTEFNFNSLKGKQEFYPDTLGFKTQALSFALKGHLNTIALLSKKNSKFAFFIEGGAGITGWRSLFQNLSTGDTLNNLGWSNPNKEYSFYIPAGIKLEYQISSKLSTYFTSNYNMVFSDLLDGAVIGNFDSYSNTSLGINYYFGKQKETPKLLSYRYFEITYDSLADQPAKKEIKQIIAEEVRDGVNPFSINLEVPETAPHRGFDIRLNIAKFGIPAKGFFRLLVPSGFLPQAVANDDISFMKLGYRYEYDFILPMNQDSTNIPIHIKLSEIEKGTFPILVEGEIIDQKGNVFPLKFAAYTEIISEDEWYQGLSVKKQQEVEAKRKPENEAKTIFSDDSKLLVQKEKFKPAESETGKIAQQKKSSKGIYHIQIMARTKPHPNLKAYKAKHNITEDIFIIEEAGWYRYNLYSTKDANEANSLVSKVRNETGISDAFLTYYENGKRLIPPSVSRHAKAYPNSMYTYPQDQKVSTKAKSTRPEGITSTLNNNIVYRIEIAQAFDQPIPINLIQNIVEREPISEFKQEQSFYYTIGEFEDPAVAKAFLEYVKFQFNLENAQICQYRKNHRIKVVL